MNPVKLTSGRGVLTATLADAENPVLAQSFVDFLAGDGAQTLLNGYGFESP